MEKIVLVIHLIVAVAMVLVVLVQRSEGAGLMGPSQGGGMMPVRGSANIVTRTTGILAAIFFVTSLTLAILAGGHNRSESLADSIAQQENAQQVAPPVDGAPAAPAPAIAPAAPATPEAPQPPVPN
jgi:preprotein translocase subunit SecG